MRFVSSRLFTAFAALLLTLPAFGQAQPEVARVGRFSYASDPAGDPTYSTFVIPLDHQKGVQLHPTSVAPWISGQNANYYPWFFKVTSHTRYLMAKSGPNSVSYPFAFVNPIASFGSQGGGSPLYIGKQYRFGFYAGGQSADNDLPDEASIQVYSRASFVNLNGTVGHPPTTVHSLDLPHWKDAAAVVTSDWQIFGNNGYQKTFTTFANGAPVLETTIQFALAKGSDQSWAAKYNAPLLITHRALGAAKDYYFMVNYRGVTRVGEKVAWMAVTDTSSPETSGSFISGYAMDFEEFPAWGSTLLKTPSFQGDPAPPTYYGKTAEEISTLAPRFDVALEDKLKNSAGTTVTVPAAGDYKSLGGTPELRSHSSLDAFAKQLGSNPLTIANYVHNEIGLTDALGYNETGDLDEMAVNSGGMNRGAVGAYLEGQGSPEEQCALLLYLLRKAGVQAAYITPPHDAVDGVATSPVKILDQRLSNLLRMRVKGALTPDGHTPVPKFIGINYPWVAAYVPSDPADPGSPKKWIHLFPWLKDTEVIEGQNIEGYLPSNSKTIRQWVKKYIIAQNNSPLWQLDPENLTPGNIFTKDLQKNLESNWPGVSIDDLGIRFRDRKFNRNSWDQFPQPCQVDATKTFTLSDTLAADDKIYDTMDITISSVQNQSKKITLTGLRTMDFHNRRAVVNFEKAGGSNFTLSFTLQPFDPNNPEPGTNSNFSLAADPYLLKKQKSFITVGNSDKDFKFSVTYHRHRTYPGKIGMADQAIIGGWATFLGINEIDFGPGGPAAAGAPIESFFRLGDLNAFCVNAGRVTERMVQVHLEPLWKHQQERAANPTTVNPDYDLIQETTAYLMGMTYYQRVSRSFDDLKNLFKVHVVSMRAHGFAQLGAARSSNGIPITGLVDVPIGDDIERIQQCYPVIDMNFVRGAWAAYGDVRPDAGGQQMINGSDFMTGLMTIEQSALEDHTIKQYFKEEQADAVSTIDLIRRHGAVELTAENYENQITKLYSYGGVRRTLPEWQGERTWTKIETALSGWDKDLATVYVTRGPVSGAKNQWVGVGALIMGKESGAAMIGPVLNGGYGSSSPSLAYSYGLDPFNPSEVSINTSSLYLSEGFITVGNSFKSENYNNGSFYSDDIFANPLSAFGLGGSGSASVYENADPLLAQIFKLNMDSYFGYSVTDLAASARTYFDVGPVIVGTGFTPVGFSPYAGDPVNMITGEMYTDEVDLSLPGPIPLEVRRNYGSQVLTHGSFGYGWKMAYFPYLYLNEDKTKIHAAEADGSVIVYRRNTSNVTEEEWIVDAADNPLLTNGRGGDIGSIRNLFRNRITRIAANPSGQVPQTYRLFDASGGVRVYETRSYPVFGASPAISRERPYLAKWSDSVGNCLDFFFYGDGNPGDAWHVPDSNSSYGQLAVVKASNGNSLGFNYDISGRILEAYTGDGRRVSYRYDEYGDLREVTRPDASWVKYDYLREKGKVGDSSNEAWYSTHLIEKETWPGGRVVQSEYQPYVVGDKNEKGEDIKSWQVGKASHLRRVTKQSATVGHQNSLQPTIPAEESSKLTRIGTYAYTNTSDANNLITGRTVILDAYNRKTVYYYEKSRLVKVADPTTVLTDEANGAGSNFKVVQEWYSAGDVTGNVAGQPGAWAGGLKSTQERNSPRIEYRYNPQGDLTEKKVIGELDGDPATTGETLVTKFSYNANHLPETIIHPNPQDGTASGKRTRYYYDDSARPYFPTKVEELSPDEDLLTRATSVYADFFTIAGDLTKPYSKGLVSEMRQAAGTLDEALVSCTYSPAGFKKTEIRSSGGVQSTHPDAVKQYSYNLRGELVEERVMDGNLAKKTNRYAYDDMGRRIWLERLDADKKQVAWDYTYYNKTGDVEWTDGSRTNPEDFTYTRYDGAGRVVEKTGVRSRAKIDGSGVEAVPGQEAYSTNRYFYNLFGDLVKVMDPRGNTVKMTHDSLGRILTKTAYNGDWQKSGSLVLSTLSYVYDDSGNKITTTDARRGVTRVYKTSAGMPWKQENPDGQVLLWTYYLDGRPRKVPTSAFIYTEYAYDDVNRLITATVKNINGQVLGSSEKVMDRRGNIVSSTDIAGLTSITSYDKLNRIITTNIPQSDGPGSGSVSSASQSVTMSYDAAGYYRKSVNALNEITETTYDSLERPLKTEIRKSDGTIVRSSEVSYRPDFQSIVTTNGSGSTKTSNTVWTDIEGRTVLVKAADGTFTRTEYDNVGNAVAVRDSAGQITRSSYDGLNRLATVTLPDGALTSFVYIYPVGGGERFERIMPGNLIEVKIFDRFGRIEETYLEGAGAQKSRHNKGYSYYISGKERGLLAQFEDSNNLVHSFTYDNWCRMHTVTIGDVNTAKYVKKEFLGYDVRGMFTSLRETTTPEGSSGMQVSQVDRSYDLQGHLYDEKVSLGTGPGDLTVATHLTESFDGAGRRKALSRGTSVAAQGAGTGGAWGFSYRADGLLESTSAGTGTYSFTYDNRGLLTGRVNPFRDHDAVDKPRDDRGRLMGTATQLDGSSANLFSENLSWTDDSKQHSYTSTRLISADGTGTATWEDTRNYTYSPARRQLQSESYIPDNGQIAKKLEYEFDHGVSGGLGIRTLSLSGAGANVQGHQVGNQSNAVGWDSFSRVTHEVAGYEKIGLSVQGIALGAKTVGLRVGGDAELSGVDFPQTTSRTTGEWGRNLWVPSGGTYSLNANATHPSGLSSATASSTFTLAARHLGVSNNYDSDGALIGREIAGGISVGGRSQTLTWDGAGRLIKIVQTEGGGFGFKWSAVYDGLNRRIQTKTIWQGTGSGLGQAAQPNVTQLSWYDPLVEFLEVGLEVTRNSRSGAFLGSERWWKVHGPDLNGGYGGLQGMGGLEAMINESTGEAVGMVDDVYGTIIGYSKALNTGGVTSFNYVSAVKSFEWNVARFSGYGPLPGNWVPCIEELTAVWRCFGWRGKRLDVTGFYNLGARYYEPNSGRFVSPDPLGHLASMGLYDYAGGDPINFVDPSGRSAMNPGYGFVTSSLNSKGDLTRQYDGLHLEDPKPLWPEVNTWYDNFGAKIWYDKNVRYDISNNRTIFEYIYGTTPDDLPIRDASIDVANIVSLPSLVRGLGALGMATIREGMEGFALGYAGTATSGGFRWAMADGSMAGGTALASEFSWSASGLGGAASSWSMSSSAGSSLALGYDASLVFYSVQSEAHAARLLSGGGAWPSAPTHAHLGEGLYTWGASSDAQAYLSLLEGRGVQGLRVMEARISGSEYNALRTMDLRVSDDFAEAWIGRHSNLYGEGIPHGFDHVIHKTSNFGAEFFFSKDVFPIFQIK